MPSHAVFFERKIVKMSNFFGCYNKIPLYGSSAKNQVFGKKTFFYDFKTIF